MAVNTQPSFTNLGAIDWSAAAITAANTAKDGTGTVTTVFTADAVDGSFLKELRFRSVGTNVATVARIFLNNGLTNATATNNTLFDEISLVATTLSETLAQAMYSAPMNLMLPPGYTVFVTLGTAVAAGWRVTGVGGDY